MVNLVTDTFPSFALGCEATDDEVMTESPRPKTEGFFAHKIGIVIFLEGVMIGLLTFAAYAIGHFANPNTDLGHTMAFMTLASSQLFHAFNMKSNKSILNKKLFNNKWLIISFIALMAVQLLVCYITPVANVFQLVSLEPKYLMICLGLSASTIVFVELGKLIVKLTYKK
jgi:Ca2+-transporting ATPase